MMIRSQKIIDTARGAECAFRFPGICQGGTETTVWAHLNGAKYGKGAGNKAHDVLGAPACYRCHAYLDVGHGTKPLISTETLLECVLEAVTGTWVRLIQSGVVSVPQDKQKPAHEVPVKPRKPRNERAKINSRTEWPTGQKLQSRNTLRRKERT